MPGQLDPGKTRISYAEWTDTVEYIDKLAAEERVDRTKIIRDFVNACTKISQRMTKEAKKRGVRVTTLLDEVVSEVLRKSPHVKQ